MAKKVRAPAPPRKVQAPKVRQKQDVGRGGGGGFAMPSTNVLIGVGLAALVALVIVAVVVFSGGGSGGGYFTSADVAKVRAAVTAAGGTMQSPLDDRRDIPLNHMSSQDQRVVYKTFPASSGVHNPSTSIWGNYRNPVDPRQAVHNLEHGGVVIWYGPDISTADRAALDRFYDEDENGLIITPIPDPYPGVVYPKHDPLGSKIALTVWTVPEDDVEAGRVHIAVLPRFDQKAFAAFRDTFRGKGLERIPVSQMLPGGN